MKNDKSLSELKKEHARRREETLKFRRSTKIMDSVSDRLWGITIALVGVFTVLNLSIWSIGWAIGVIVLQVLVVRIDLLMERSMLEAQIELNRLEGSLETLAMLDEEFVESSNKKALKNASNS